MDRVTDDGNLGAASIARGTRLKELAAVFLKLGTIAFGGPAAHIAMMDDEVVKRRRWLDKETFLDLLGATNLIPGPNSTELAIHLGLHRAGFAGLMIAGSAFILPAVLIVMALAFLYVRYGSLPEVTWLMYGIKPVIIAIVLKALWGLSRSAVKNVATGVAGGVVVALSLIGWNEIALLFPAGLAVMLVRNKGKFHGRGVATFLLPLHGMAGTVQLGAGADVAALSRVFFFFLKVGSVLYGSGYVLLAFLRADLVERWGWLTSQQLLDAVAVGQFTPGPVFTTATFIGYVIGGVPGAILATIGIFLPSFVFVALTNPWIPKLRESSWASGFLDGVNVASLALVAVVTWQLGFAAVVDGVTAALVAISALLVFRTNVNSAWVVIGGGVVGLLAHLLR